MLKKFLRFFFIDDVLREDIAFLKKMPLFCELSDRSLAKVALIIFKKTYLAGEKIYENNNEANVVYLVKSGQVNLLCGNINKVVEEEGFFGETSLIENAKRTCLATVLKDSELYLIYRAKFEDMVESNGKIGLIIMKNLASMFAARLKCSEV
ncbi:MAG: Crp/Fnr family transcriptional regulator [Endomicrobium sp.]|nr:Crp/Fnr family transcriptional regulator [Endomicrobium sp.]